MSIILFINAYSHPAKKDVTISNQKNFTRTNMVTKVPIIIQIGSGTSLRTIETIHIIVDAFKTVSKSVSSHEKNDTAYIEIQETINERMKTSIIIRKD